MKPVLDAATVEIIAQKEEVARLKSVADQHPFYKYNGLWTRELQNLVCLELLSFCKIDAYTHWMSLGLLHRAVRLARWFAGTQGSGLRLVHDD